MERNTTASTCVGGSGETAVPVSYTPVSVDGTERGLSAWVRELR